MSGENEAYTKLDLMDPNADPDEILARARRQKAIGRLAQESATLMDETAALENGPDEQQMRELLMDFESLRSMRHHEIITNFFMSFRNTFTGDPNDESMVYESGMDRVEHIQNCEQKAKLFNGLRSDEALRDSKESFLDMIRSLHVVRMYDENAEGLTQPYAVPVWIIGREQKDGETAEYTAVSLGNALPGYAVEGYSKFYRGSDSTESDSLSRASKVIHTIRSDRTYESERLFPRLLDTFGILHFMDRPNFRHSQSNLLQRILRYLAIRDTTPCELKMKSNGTLAALATT